ncbi:hypothetical protein K438DRAFT_1600490, partial [Mycena galopus ATCC 62051]
IVWPRAATLAEIFWTGAKQPNGAPLVGTEVLLRQLRFRMVQRGVGAIALQL